LAKFIRKEHETWIQRVAVLWSGSNHMELEAIVKVIVYGVPALLIVLGFFAYVGGTTAEAIGAFVEAAGVEWTGDTDLKSLGKGMIATGIIIYIIELIVYFYLESQ